MIVFVVLGSFGISSFGSGRDGRFVQLRSCILCSPLALSSSCCELLFTEVPLNLSVNHIKQQLYLQAAISLGESVKEVLLVAPYDAVLSFAKEMVHLYAEFEKEGVDRKSFRRYVDDLVASAKEFLQVTSIESPLPKREKHLV
ncbi:hypothetical protein ACFE04_020792 [Oxalis oulophora]